MHYDFPPYRPPSEANSLLLRLTRGCPWNRCAFCSMYKQTPFERRPTEEIIKDIETAKKIYGPHPATVFLGDSNNLVLDADKLVEILHHLYRTFPKIERVTSYARARTLCKKSMEDLRSIRQAGLTRLHIGLETGDPELLKEIKRGPHRIRWSRALFVPGRRALRSASMSLQESAARRDGGSMRRGRPMS